MRGLAHWAACAAVLLLASGCGESVEPETEGEPAIDLAPASGDGQQGMAGRELPEPLRVRVTRDGDPAAGIVVAWTTQDGTLAGEGATDADGMVTARWTLPRLASSELRAHAGLPGHALPGVDFHATASFPSLEMFGGNEQQGLVGTELPEPLRVRVTWRGAPLEGEPIRWSSNVVPLGERTNADGIAAGSWRVRTVPGAISAWARLEGSNPPGVSFRAVALCPPTDQCVRFSPLAYVRQGIVLLSSLDGSEPVALAEGASRPAWSPDGSHIAFTRPMHGSLRRWELCVVRADGTDSRCIVGDQDGTIVGRPSWSPDDGKIAFAHFVYSCPNGQCGQLGGYFSSLWVLDIASMLVDTVATPPLTSVSWSPGGGRIAFTAFGVGTFGRGALGVVNPDGTGLEILAPSLGSYSVAEVAWSPDGSRLGLALFDEHTCPWLCDTAIGVVEADATGLRVLATARTGNDRYVSSPAWSPDGTRLAYTLSGLDAFGDDVVEGGSDILVVSADGGASEVVVAGGGLPAWRP